jgi:hypothetical protein
MNELIGGNNKQMTTAFLFLPILHSKMNVNFNITKYTGVMAFYAVLTYVLFPAIAYFLFGKTLEVVGNGFIAGSVVSVVLWQVYGFGLVKG